MSSSVITQSDGSALKPKTKSLFQRFKPALWLAPFALFFYLFQLAPMVWVLINSFFYDDELSLENYAEVFDSAFMMQAFGNSLWLSIWSSIVGLAIATLLVSSLRRVDSKIRDAVIAFTNMSSNFSGVPLSFAFIIILGTNGAITLLLKQYGLLGDFDLYGKWGLLAIYIYFQIPLAVLLLYPAFDALSDDWQAASALLGAKTWQYWTKIALPVLSPALFGTFIILIASEHAVRRFFGLVFGFAAIGLWLLPSANELAQVLLLKTGFTAILCFCCIVAVVPRSIDYTQSPRAPDF
jgi:putative spermidine/putrescine transport system permease protein